MDLRLIGLTDYEQRTYEALIKLGKSSANHISREARVSYGKIYQVLGLLEAKGLVMVVPEKSKRFVATSPESLIRLVDEKEKDLKDIKSEISNLKQLYESKDFEVVQAIKGQRNFYKIIKELKPPKQFDYSIKYSSEYRPEWVNGEKTMLKKGLDIKTLTRYDSETQKNVKKWLKVNKNIKILDNKGVAIDIRDSEVLITQINNNTIITIKDEAFTQIMKKLFENTYKNAEKINRKLF